jgi:DNA (cytosine-5)-methyltransferase 1
VNGLALCAGVGGLELGLHLALGDDYRTVCFVEREAHAAACLVARMAEGIMAPAPVWDDLTTFDGRRWRGYVDIVSGGFPCQPWSVAGKRLKTDDRRWLWPHVYRVVCEVRPRLVFLENVAGLLDGGIEHVLAGLAAQGFDGEWNLFRAADVGAPHERERVFILATDADADLVRPQRERTTQERAWSKQQLEGLLQDSLRNAVPAGSRSGMDDGVAGRSFRLESIGNGVVPLVAAHAFRTLAAALMEGHRISDAPLFNEESR